MSQVGYESRGLDYGYGYGYGEEWTTARLRPCVKMRRRAHKRVPIDELGLCEGDVGESFEYDGENREIGEYDGEVGEYEGEVDVYDDCSTTTLSGHLQWQCGAQHPATGQRRRHRRTRTECGQASGMWVRDNRHGTWTGHTGYQSIVGRSMRARWANTTTVARQPCYLAWSSHLQWQCGAQHPASGKRCRHRR